ncbi:MAG: MerR family transcriptional regulator [Myxococcota bacterium]
MNDGPKNMDNPQVGVSIGAMSRATGIPSNTLRTWERRYGFPKPQRTQSGQRLYDPALIAHLRLIQKALDAGHRPKQVLSQTADQLAQLLGTVAPFAPASGDSEVEAWLTAARALDGRALDNLMRTEAAQLGLMGLLSDRIAPFLMEMGLAWRRGDMEVYQEHWASERLRRFLTECWEPMSQSGTGPVVVATTLPGDRHDLGLQMACVVAALCGWRIVFLGRDTPVDDIHAAVKTSGASAVLISVSTWTDSQRALRDIDALREQIPPEVALVTGGAGAPEVVPGIARLPDLDSLYRWASGHH